MSALRAWWSALQPREQRMVAVMLAAVAAFAFWYGLVAPLRGLRDDRIARYDRAVADREAVGAGVAALRGARPGGQAIPAAVATDALMAHAAAAGVIVARRRTTADGALELGIDAVDAPVLFAWLDAAARDHGVAPGRLLVEAAGASVRAELVFVLPPPAGGPP